MDIHKSTSKSYDSLRQPNKGRRSFIWKIGAGMSAVMTAAVPGIAGSMFSNDSNLKSGADRLTRQIGILEDENNIRLLHQTYENLLDRCVYKEVVNLFTDDGEVVFNGGVFKGKNRGINRLFFYSVRTGIDRKKDRPPAWNSAGYRTTAGYG